MLHAISLIFFLAVLIVGTGGPAGADEEAASATVRTAKERLTDKASDEQRVNDCKVALAKRTRVRPTDCSSP